MVGREKERRVGCTNVKFNLRVYHVGTIHTKRVKNDNVVLQLT